MTVVCWSIIMRSVAVLMWASEIRLLSAQEPWKIKLASNYELRFYDYKIFNFSTAEALCAKNRAIMVKLYDKNIRRTVYETLPSATIARFFWIGANGTLNDWIWFDGTPVDGSILKWNTGQPDNYLRVEHNLILSKNLNYSDIRKNYQSAGTVCQRFSDPLNPTILNNESHSCNSSMTIKWKPHHRAVGIEHILRITLDGNSSNREEFNITPRNDSLQFFVLQDLKSWSRYTVMITPCVTCTPSYSAKSNITTVGPGPVANAYIDKRNRSCEIYWTPPSVTPISFITGYKVTISNTVVKSPLWAAVPPAGKEVYESSPLNVSYNFLPQPNRKYKVMIQSRACAGLGEEMMATGGCATESEAPSKISTPRKSSNILEDGRLIISLQPPDESNGPISCLFIVVQHGQNGNKNFSMNEAKLQLLNSTSNNEEYISAVIMPHRWFTGTSITLGDNSTTSCNIRKNTVGGKEITHGNFTYVGRNIPLIGYSAYRIFVVSATASDKAVLFQASDALIVEQTISYTVIFYVVIAILTVIAAAGGIAIIFLVKRRQSTSETISRPNIPREHSPIPVEPHVDSGYADMMAIGDKGLGPSVVDQRNPADENLYANVQDVISMPSLTGADGEYEMPISAYASVQ